MQADIHLLSSRHYDALDVVLNLEKILPPVPNSRVVPARSGGVQTARRGAMQGQVLTLPINGSYGSSGSGLLPDYLITRPSV